MAGIYSAFSNPTGDLEQLKVEFASLFNFFNDKGIKQKADYSFSLNETIEDITSDIIARQKEISLFHFSGHSGGAGLDFQEADFQTEHVAGFFNAISGGKSGIECVVLNGCENAEIVNRLSAVPVVIGTRTKIRDVAAQKFTRDFFAALINAGRTYRQAFEDAVAAQHLGHVSVSGKTRGEGGMEVEGPVLLNDYFLVINNARIADRTFPFRKAPHNWVRTLVIFFVLITALLIYMFRVDVEKMIKGYSCAPIKVHIDTNKCNFVFADFRLKPDGSNVSDWLFDNIPLTNYITTYLNAIHIGEFKNVIYQSMVTRETMPSRCGYEFNLTGGLTEQDGKYLADFDVFPFDVDPPSPKRFEYSVASIKSIDSMFIYLDKARANQFVLFEMCAACAQHQGRKELLEPMQEILELYTYSNETAPSYQFMQYRMAELSLELADTARAVRALDAATKAAPNDFSLKAHERLIEVRQFQGNPRNLHNAQSAYLQALETRTTRPGSFTLSRPASEYAAAASSIQHMRAQLVFKHRDDELKDKREEAIKDFQQLNQMQYRGRRYSEEISTLRTPASSIIMQPHHVIQQ